MEIPADSIDAEGTAAVPVTVPLPILCGGEIAVEAAREFMERQVKAAIVRHDQRSQRRGKQDDDQHAAKAAYAHERAGQLLDDQGGHIIIMRHVFGDERCDRKGKPRRADVEQIAVKLIGHSVICAVEIAA